MDGLNTAVGPVLEISRWLVLPMAVVMFVVLSGGGAALLAWAEDHGVLRQRT